MKQLKLKGNIEGKFKQLEVIISRLLLKQKIARTVVEKPLSVVSHYIEASPDDGLLFVCGMFKGCVRKILFLTKEIEGKETPNYVATIGSETNHQRTSIMSKKKTVVLDVNINVNDGDMIKLEMTTPDITLKNVFITALIEFDSGVGDKKEYNTEMLLDKFEERLNAKD